MKYIKHSTVALVAILLNGCMEISTPKFEEKENIIVYDDSKQMENVLDESNIINLDDTKKSITNFNIEEIIVSAEDNNYPPRELLAKVDPITFENKSYGDIISILTSEFKHTSVIFKPNLDPNIKVYFRAGEKRLIDLIREISENIGYYAYYDKKRNSLILAPNQKKIYNIPAGIFVKMSASQQLGSAGGNGTGGIDLIVKSSEDVLLENLALLGSSDKMISLDKDSGKLIIKEHPIYFEEIDEYIIDFVRDRSRKFIVEIGILDVALSKIQNMGLDLESLSYGGSNTLFSLANLGGSNGGLNGGIIRDSSGGIDPASDGLSFNATLNMLNENSNAVLVDKEKVLLSNHNVNYMANGNTQTYIKGYNVIDSVSGSRTIPEFGTVFDGISFVSRVDAHRGKDYIEVSMAPSVKTASFKTVPGENGDYQIPTESARETISTVNLKSGETIIFGGLIRTVSRETLQNNPYFEDIPLLDDLGSDNKDKIKVETIFVVKVTELTDVKQTYDIASSKMRRLAEDEF